MKITTSETILQHLERIVPPGHKCHGCIKGDPNGIEGYSGDVFCHLLEEAMEDGDKQCGINDDRCTLTTTTTTT